VKTQKMANADLTQEKNLCLGASLRAIFFAENCAHGSGFAGLRYRSGLF
jgi:hypothetical protein